MRRLLAAVMFALALPFGVQAADIVVGSKKFTESVILGEIARIAIPDATHRRELGGTRVLWNALRRGDIDIYPEYTGTIRAEILAGDNLSDDTALADALAAHGIRATAALGFNNTYAIGMLEDRAAALGINSISDLTRHPALRFGLSNEFMDRGDGWPALKRRYGLAPANLRGLDHDLAYRALAAGDIDVMDLYATDAEIPYYAIRVLADDKGHFSKYDAVYLYRVDLARRAPDAVAALVRLGGRINAAEMSAMNKAVKIDRKTETAVAAAFVRTALGADIALAAPESRASRLLRATGEHLSLVGVSLFFAIALAVPLGIWAWHRPGAGHVILGVTGMIQTIPALALLVFMIPLLGIGAVPAMVALFLYSLLPIVRNTHAGLAGIDEPVRRSALALGLAPRDILRRIELPLALPLILAGVKTAAVINIGTATLGALIGAGGYGQAILTGIRLDDVRLILEGAVPAAALALLAQGGFEFAERMMRRNAS